MAGSLNIKNFKEIITINDMDYLIGYNANTDEEIKISGKNLKLAVSPSGTNIEEKVYKEQLFPESQRLLMFGKQNYFDIKPKTVVKFNAEFIVKSGKNVLCRNMNFIVHKTNKELISSWVEEENTFSAGDSLIDIETNVLNNNGYIQFTALCKTAANIYYRINTFECV